MRLPLVLASLALATLATSCLSAADLSPVLIKLDELERVAADEMADDSAFGDALKDLGNTVAGVAKQAEARAEAWWESAEGAAGGGVLGLATMVLTNLYRNSQRRKRGEPVKVEEVA